ncbi:TetR/AcrR family transcriptional regulator [Rhodococcus daqingensis]|uniref:TetR/AcrR family transcriptional regulator n=1 Tax=Rhodococcus daqingensis TaxID=2479363 RepID=A0ABW2S518_9NOCA
MDDYLEGPAKAEEPHPSDVRRSLVTAAAHLLAENGPTALSARKVANAAGTSTMSVYTRFGSMEALVRAVVDEGFAVLEGGLLAVPTTEDPLRDVAAQTAAYLRFASENAALYAVMFGTVPLGGFRPVTPEELQAGRRETLDRVGANLARAVDTGRLRPAKTSDLAFTWWSAVHGYAMLESSGHIHAEPGRSRVLERLMVALFTGLGDDLDGATGSVRAGRDWSG